MRRFRKFLRKAALVGLGVSAIDALRQRNQSSDLLNDMQTNLSGESSDITPVPTPTPAPSPMPIFGEESDVEPVSTPAPSPMPIFGEESDAQLQELQGNIIENQKEIIRRQKLNTPAPSPMPIFGEASDSTPAPTPTPVPTPAPESRDRVEVAEIKNTNLKNVEAGTVIAPRRSDNSFIPSAVRQFMYDLAGGTEDFTEANLTDKEYSTLQKVVKRAMADGRNFITYKDYEALATITLGKVNKAGVVDQILALGDKLQDPAFSLKVLLGEAAFTVNDNGEVILSDKYDFNNLKDSFKDRFDNDMFYADDLDGADFLDYLKATYRIGGDVYRQFRNTAAFFGSNPGDKSTMIKINLGILDE